MDFQNLQLMLISLPVLFCFFYLTLSFKGRGSKEQLPMVLKVPRLKKSTLSVCLRPYSLLGFGDILVPGKYSVQRKRGIYFICTHQSVLIFF